MADRVVCKCQWCGAIALVTATPQAKLDWLIEHDECWSAHTVLTTWNGDRWVATKGSSNGNEKTASAVDGL